jgi:putative restriction endonuclease
MPAVEPQELVDALLDAVQDSGFSGSLISSPRKHPRRFAITDANGNQFVLSVYAWTLTFGGRPQLKNEYRIQMTSVTSPLEIFRDGPTVLLGYEPNLGLFAGFDLSRHRTFTPGSSSVQIDIGALKEAETDGLSFHRKSNDEVAVGIRPDQLMTYAMNADAFHRFGKEAKIVNLLERATSAEEIPEQDVSNLSAERRRLVETVSRLSRLTTFRRLVLFAYGNRCAIPRVQLKLVDAAHILPVGAPGSSDHVRNGLALSPTYHRAFDTSLIYLDEEYRMQMNAVKLKELAALQLDGGVEAFKAPLGRIFLPPDKNQWPAPDFIRKANRFRQIA